MKEITNEDIYLFFIVFVTVFITLLTVNMILKQDLTVIFKTVLSIRRNHNQRNINENVENENIENLNVEIIRNENIDVCPTIQINGPNKPRRVIRPPRRYDEEIF